MPKKIFILLPDGVSLRNFAFTEFYNIGMSKGFEIVFWNNTPFDLSEYNFDQIKLVNPKIHPISYLLKNAKRKIELIQNIKRTNDNVYKSYIFPKIIRNNKDKIKNYLENGIIFFNNSQNGLKKITNKIHQKERMTKHYHDCLELLSNEKPDFVFCTNQRISEAIAPILAAQDLNIPTATFIFSWDNLPKATKVLDTDYYFVWSKHMKDELKFYYPYVNENKIKITGTPQFETHLERKELASKIDFFNNNFLDINKKYICFSGDDVTTSPNDPIYLENTVNAVRKLNEQGYNLGIIFRRCPVDFSNRYQKVLENNTDIIVSVEPKWIKKIESWQSILPTREDMVLLMNTIQHTELVLNIGSSMVFDYACFNKPCGYLNYDVENPIDSKWSVNKVYNYVHFRSMPSKASVFWINSEKDIEIKIKEMLSEAKNDVLENSKKWFEKINQHPIDKASDRIWNCINEIIIKKND